MRTLAEMKSIFQKPTLFVSASPSCNLSCEYCTMGLYLTKEVVEGILSDPAHLEFIKSIPPTHLYLLGGEPFYHPSLDQWVRTAGEAGHVISLDTNLTIKTKQLQRLIENWDPAWFGYIDISHHLVERVPQELLIRNANLFQEKGIPCFIKYLGVPEHLPDIPEKMERVKDEGIGTTLSILYGAWKGKQYPRDYTDEELLFILDHTTLGVYGLQCFLGVKSYGLPCRGGADFAHLNMTGRGELIPCCNAGGSDIQMDSTFWKTGSRERKPCPVNECFAVQNFAYGANGLSPEFDRLASITLGPTEPLGRVAALQYIADIVDQGVELVLQERFDDIYEKVMGKVPA